jgi:hypothetical protein
MKTLTMSPNPPQAGSSFNPARGKLQMKRIRGSWAIQLIGSIGCRNAALFGSILAALVTTAAAQTLTAPVAPKKQKKPAPSPPSISQRDVQGVVPRAFRGGNPLQMLNPKAPAKYGTWVESTSFDPNVPGKWKGIKLFEIFF